MWPLYALLVIVLACLIPRRKEPPLPQPQPDRRRDLHRDYRP